MSPGRLKQIDGILWRAGAIAGKAGSWLMRARGQDQRPAILRPGGMGDLILLCVAAEELGYDLRGFFWIVERRSEVWAAHLGLDYVCYDRAPLAQHWRLAGRFPRVVNSEQWFGLSQATALLACGRGSTLACFSTNRAASWGQQCVPYDPDSTHEAASFRALLAAAMGDPGRALVPAFPRARKAPPTALPVVGLAGAGTPAREFTGDQWAAFVRPWADGRRFWIASAETDRPLARRLRERFQNQAQVFEGRFSAMCELVRDSEEVFTVDSGFLHIASYYGVPATAVFTSGRERKWSALAPGSRIVRRSGLACQPCTRFGQVPECRNRLACKELIFEEHVRACAVRY